MVYAHNQANDQNYESIDKELQHSVLKSHELYYYMLLLPIAMKRLAIKRIENGRNKLRPTDEEKNPNLKFVQNKFVKALEENQALNDFLSATGIEWDNELVKTIFSYMTTSEVYSDYMNSSESSFDEDMKFWVRFYNKELPKIDVLYDSLELENIYWNDDVEFAISIAVKTFKTFTEDNAATVELLPVYKDSDDREFVSTLLRKTLSTYNSTFELIKKYSRNWDPERVAQMDVIIIVMAAAEMMSFHEIPIRVTLNEYIEISKFYSTEKSNVYINGILEKIVRQMVEESLISPAQLVNSEVPSANNDSVEIPVSKPKKPVVNKPSRKSENKPKTSRKPESAIHKNSSAPRPKRVRIARSVYPTSSSKNSDIIDD